MAKKTRFAVVEEMRKRLAAAKKRRKKAWWKENPPTDATMVRGNRAFGAWVDQLRGATESRLVLSRFIVTHDDCAIVEDIPNGQPNAAQLEQLLDTAAEPRPTLHGGPIIGPVPWRSTGALVEVPTEMWRNGKSAEAMVSAVEDLVLRDDGVRRNQAGHSPPDERFPQHEWVFMGTRRIELRLPHWRLVRRKDLL